MTQMTVDALDGSGITDYNRLMTEFGIKSLERLPSSPHFFMTRGILFGQTDFSKILDAMSHGNSFAVMTGIKPTGSYHIGSIATAQELVYFQQQGGKVYYCIADVEAFATNRTSLETSAENAVDNLAELLALGLDPSPEKAFFYRQSSQREVLLLSHLLSSIVTKNTLEGIYGVKPRIGYYNAALVQVADILLPQILEGPIPTLTPIGADQAPHARLTRDIVRRKTLPMIEKYVLPAFTYHYMIEGIDGSPKMSKRYPMSVFSMGEPMSSIKQKIANALTGGRDTAREQRELGGQPHKCRVFDLFRFLFEPSDDDLEQRAMMCREGSLLCGPCKKELVTEIEEFREIHLYKKSNAMTIAREIASSTPQQP